MRIIAMLVLLSAVPNPAVAYEVGDTIEDFTLPDLTGSEGSLHDYSGKIIVLNFFTTWCPGCNEEADRLENNVWKIYRERKVTVLAVDIQEQIPLVQGWAAAQDVTYPILMAPDWLLFDEFPNSLGIPYNAVIDRNMVIRYGATGFDLQAITGMVETILAEDLVPTTGAAWGAVKALFY